MAALVYERVLICDSSIVMNTSQFSTPPVSTDPAFLSAASDYFAPPGVFVAVATKGESGEPKSSEFHQWNLYPPVK